MSDFLNRVQSLVNDITFGDYEFEVRLEQDGKVGVRGSYFETDSYDGVERQQFTRPWILHDRMSDSEIVQTIFALCRTSMEHRTRELFTFRGGRIFGPHFNVYDLLHLSRSAEMAGNRHELNRGKHWHEVRSDEIRQKLTERFRSSELFAIYADGTTGSILANELPGLRDVVAVKVVPTTLDWQDNSGTNPAPGGYVRIRLNNGVVSETWQPADRLNWTSSGDDVADEISEYVIKPKPAVTKAFYEAAGVIPTSDVPSAPLNTIPEPEPKPEPEPEPKNKPVSEPTSSDLLSSLESLLGGEWISWDPTSVASANEIPPALTRETVVKVKFRNGNASLNARPAGAWRWNSYGRPDDIFWYKQE